MLAERKVHSDFFALYNSINLRVCNIAQTLQQKQQTLQQKRETLQPFRQSVLHREMSTTEKARHH